MLSVNNVLAFFTILGFFLGAAFGLTKFDSAEMMLYSTLVVTTIFYMVGLGSSSIFLKHHEHKPRYKIKKDKYENFIDSVIIELRRREKSIKSIYTFIKELEEEEIAHYKKDKDAAVAAGKVK